MRMFTHANSIRHNAIDRIVIDVDFVAAVEMAGTGEPRAEKLWSGTGGHSRHGATGNRTCMQPVCTAAALRCKSGYLVGPKPAGRPAVVSLGRQPRLVELRPDRLGLQPSGSGAAEALGLSGIASPAR